MPEPAPPAAAPAPVDVFDRALRNLRVSVTDRCNLRCGYCMPEEEYTWLHKRDLLSFEEIALLVDAFTDVGVGRVRLTGGEPLLRRELHALVAQLAQRPALVDLALTTNGLLLADQARALRAAGLRRVTVSLDSLRRERYRALTRRDDLGRALAGIDAALAAGFESVKLNTVVLRGVNDDELLDLLEFATGRGAELRFIEYMDVGGATGWRAADVVSRSEILARVAERHGAPEPVVGRGSAPADRFRLPDGTHFGIVASTTAPFCGACDRARLTADGRWFTCLYAPDGIDLREPLRAGASRTELADLLRRGWLARRDRGAEERLQLAERSALVDSDELRRRPHLEMHTRGG